MNISQQYMASKLGVSQRTVSRALNGNGYVKPEVKDQIINLAKKLGYRKNILARSLIDGKSKVIGVFFPTFHGKYFSTLLFSIEENLFNLGYYVHLTHMKKYWDDDRFELNAMLQYQLDGIIAVPRVTIPWEDTVYPELIQQNIKILFLGQESPFPAIASVINDDFNGAYMCAKHLIEQGHRKIAFIGYWPSDKFPYLNQSNILRQRRRWLI